MRVPLIVGRVAPGIDDTNGEQGGHGYRAPSLMVIGTVRNRTAGSTSSGYKDANTQYYW